MRPSPAAGVECRCSHLFLPSIVVLRLHFGRGRFVALAVHFAVAQLSNLQGTYTSQRLLGTARSNKYVIMGMVCPETTAEETPTITLQHIKLPRLQQGPSPVAKYNSQNCNRFTW